MSPPAAPHAERADAYLQSVEFRVLGPVEYVDGGTAESLGSPKQRAVLAMLLKDAGQIVSVDQLIRGVWGDDGSDSARNSLHTYISNLRAIIGGRIDRTGNGYRLDVSRDQVDSHLFESLADRAQGTLTATPADASRELRGALAMWRGRPYADIPDVPGLQEEVRRLEERRLAVVENRIDADLASGRHSAIIGELEALAEEHPLREGLRSRHMVALYRDGRQAEALRAYQRTREYLASELGIEPSIELQKTEDSILRHDPVLMSTTDVRTEDLAFLYTDVEGSTVLWETRPDAMRQSLTTHDEILNESIDGVGGRVFKHTGDGMIAAFGEPAAAVRAAVSAQRALVEASWGATGALKVRMSVDAGEVESRGGDYFGPPLNRGARLMDSAHGGQIVISDEAHNRLRNQPGLQFRSLGEHRFKGLGAPQTVFQLLDPELSTDFPELRTGSAPGEDARQFGDSIRGYEIRERVGLGRFAVVYRAYQPSVGREVAVKVVRPEFANHPGFVRRFESEARLVAKLEHPHIVSLYDFWRDPEGAYLVMPWLSGRSLAAAPFGAMTLDQVIPIVRQVASALSYAHRHGVIHRDIKPANLLLDSDGNVYVADFGIAVRSIEKVVGPPSASQIYRAPEDREGQAVDERTDVYGLAAVVAELLTGAVPQELELSELAAAVRAVVERGLSERPTDRYDTVDEFAAALASAHGEEIEPARPPTVAARNPYKGLAAFGEADTADFFGREAELASLLTLVDQHRLATVVGPSGSGKSSLVRAGLVPALRRGRITGSQDWLIVDTIPGAHPFDELAIALLDVATESLGDIAAELRTDEHGLLRVAKRLTRELDAQLLLVIDQFEELYSLVSDEDTRLHFIDSLVEATQDPRSNVRVVITIRADFFDQPLLHDRLGAIVSGANLALSVPGPAALQEAIESPAARSGLHLEAGLAEQIVSDVRDEPGGLPLMQYALTALTDNASSPELTFADYQAVGAVTGALTARATAVFVELDADAQHAAQGLFLRLVSVSEDADDVRRRVRRVELQSSSSDPAATERALDAFGSARLLTFDSDPVTRGPTVEVAHEALLREWELLRSWITDRREVLLTRHRLDLALSDWLRADRKTEALPVGNRLAQLERVADDAAIRLSDEERQFLDAAVSRREHEHRRQRRLRRGVMAGFGAAAVVASFFALQAVNNANQAREATEAEITNRLASQAPVVFETSPQAGLLLAVEAFNRDDSPVTLGALQRTLVNSRGSLGYVGPDVVYTSLAWIDEERFFAAHDDGLMILGVDGSITNVPVNGGVTVVELSPDRAVAAVATATAVTLLDGSSGRPRGVELPQRDVISIAFTPDGRTVATGDRDGVVAFWDTTNGAQIGDPIEAHEESTYEELEIDPGNVCGPNSHRTDTFRIGAAELSFDSEGTRLVTAGMVVARVWDVATRAKLDETVVRRIEHTADCPTAALAISQSASRDPVRLATNGQLLVWTPGSEEGPRPEASFETVSIVGGTTAVTDVVLTENQVLFAPQGGRLVGARLGALENPLELDSQLGGQANIALSPSGQKVAHAGSGGVALWSLVGDGPISQTAGPVDADEVAVSDEGLLVANRLDPEIPPRLFRAGPEGLREIANGELEHWFWMWFIGNDLFAATDISSLSLVDRQTLLPVVEFDISEGNTVFAVDRDSSGRVLIGGFGRTIDLFEQGGGSPILTLIDPPDGRVVSVAVSPDDSRIAAASEQGAAWVWDVATREPVQPFPLSAGGGQILLLKWHPSGEFLVTMSESGTIVFRDAETLQPVRTLEGATEANAQGSFGPFFQGEGRYMITVADGPGRLWDTEEQVQVGGTFPNDPGTLAHASENGLLLASVVGGDLVLWSLDTSEWAERACRTAGRNLTQEEWDQFVGAETPYRVTCPMWESHEAEGGTQ